MKKCVAFIIVGILCLVSSCYSVKYSMSGASISKGMKTASVQLFMNHAMVAEPTLSQNLTEAVKEKIRAQTALIIINDVGDANFEGEITEYYAQPTAITGNDVASKNRFTITVKVKYTNAIDYKLSFEKSFSRYADYESSKSFDSVEKDLMKEIVDLLVEDIFNEAFARW
jgi:hypothetical protein